MVLIKNLIRDDIVRVYAVLCANGIARADPVRRGKYVRRAVPKLPEPPGAREGTRGEGPLLKLLIAGDSAAAGVGAEHQEQALLGNVVNALADEFCISWNVQATSGHKTADTLEQLVRMPVQAFDIAVTSLGVNDALSLVTVRQWRERQARLRQLLREKFGVSTLIISGLPPVHGFPALPQPLRWHAGRRASTFDQVLAADVAADGDAYFLSVRFTEDQSMMSHDGFHPGPLVYAEWGRRAAEIIRRRLTYRR